MKLLLLALTLAVTCPGAEPATLPGLPERFTNGGMAYHNAKLLSVDATGIKFQHDGGTGAISVAALDPEVKSYISKAVIAMKAAAQPASPAPKGPVPTGASLDADQVQADPQYLTQSPNLSLTGQAQGGKSRYEPWKTDYGSYDRTDTSSYQLMCTLKTLVQTRQRVRMQAFRLSRNVATHEMDLLIVGDFKVTFGGHVPTTVSAMCSATNTDTNYVALGIRERDGDKYLGWIWRAVDGKGRVVAVVSSQSAYDHFGYERPVQAGP